MVPAWEAAADCHKDGARLAMLKNETDFSGAKNYTKHFGKICFFIIL